MGLKDILFRNQRYVENLYEDYLSLWKQCIDSFDEAMKVYFEEGISEKFGFHVERTHKHESQADDKRRTIEFELYSKALLPESRGDILGLLETVDKVINKVESVLYQIYLEKISVPEIIKDEIKRISEISIECLDYVYKACSVVFKDQKDIIELSRKIDEKESECDHVERTAIAKLFASDLDCFVKYQLKELIIEMGNITDRSESVGDRLTIISVKRRV